MLNQLNPANKPAIKAWMKKWLKGWTHPEPTYRPHGPTQAHIHVDDADSQINQSGRRTGKTVSAVAQALIQGLRAAYTAVLRPGVPYRQDKRYSQSDFMPIHPGVLIQIIPPRAEMATGAMEILEWMIPDEWKILNQRGKSFVETDTTLREGSVGNSRGMTMRLNIEAGRARPGLVRPIWAIEVVSALSKGSGQGKGPDVLIYTEAHETPEIVYQRARPSTLDATRLNKQIIESIPSANPQHWTADRWYEAIEDTTGRWSAFTWTFCDNPMNSPKMLEDIWNLRGEMPSDVWHREFMAERPTGSGGYFNFMHTIIERAEPPSEPTPGTRYVAGLDHGKSINTVMIVKELSTGRTVHGKQFGREMGTTQLQQAIRREVLQWNIERLHIDGTGPAGDYMYDNLRDMCAGLSVSVRKVPMNGGDKAKLYMHYKTGIDYGAVRIPSSFSALRQQLMAIKEKHGNTRYSQFESEGNIRKDWVDAEVLAFNAIGWDSRRVARAHSLEPTPSVVPAKRLPTIWDDRRDEDDDDDGKIAWTWSSEDRERITEVNRWHEESVTRLMKQDF